MFTRTLTLAVCASVIGVAAAAHSDQPSGQALRNGETFLISADTLLAARTGQPQASAVTLIAADPTRKLAAVYAAADAIYVIADEGAQHHLLRIPARASGTIIPPLAPKVLAGCRNCRSLPALKPRRLSDIAIPAGAIKTVIADPQKPGISLDVEGTTGRHRFDYSPATGRFVSGRMNTAL